jgi:hypothetical protein
VIPGNGYMIFWADEDSSQGERHCNFKLSALGESLMLLDASLSMVDSLNFGAQTSNVALARVPNGTGDFVNQGETFATNNDNAPSGISLVKDSSFIIYPNPAKDQIRILNGTSSGASNFSVYNTIGQELLSGTLNAETLINTAELSSGIYFFKVGFQTQRFVINK